MGCTCRTQGRECPSRGENPAETPQACTLTPAITQAQFDEVPLTKEQLQLLQHSWYGIKKEAESIGVAMFVRLFDQNPDLIQIFYKRLEGDSNVGISGIGDSLRWKRHIVTVMGILSFAIQHMDEIDFLREELNKLAVKHTEFGFKSTDFTLLKEPFMYTVKKTLGDRYTDKLDRIYSIAIEFLLDTLAIDFEDWIWIT